MSGAGIEAEWLGRVAYAPIWSAMQDYTSARDEHSPDRLWLLEHDPVFTLGQAGKAEHLLAPGDIPVLHVDRGGQVTYHGPGQLVAYPLLDLRRHKIGVRELVDGLEQSGIDLLARHGIAAQRREGAPGLYVDGRKILAIGIRVRRGCCFHGIALNVDLDLEPYARINPCGYRGLEATSMALQSGQASSVEAVGWEYAAALAAHFGLTLGSTASSGSARTFHGGAGMIATTSHDEVGAKNEQAPR